MPIDQYSPRFGDLCLKCGSGERRANFTWCEACLTSAQRDAEQRLAAHAAEVMHYRPTPPLDPNGPRRCGRCSQAHALWTTTADGHLRCELCGWTA